MEQKKKKKKNYLIIEESELNALKEAKESHLEKRDHMASAIIGGILSNPHTMAKFDTYSEVHDQDPFVLAVKVAVTLVDQLQHALDTTTMDGGEILEPDNTDDSDDGTRH